MKQIFIVTATGVGIDTNVTAYESYSDAIDGTAQKCDEYGIADPKEMCLDCFKGFSLRAQCDVEVQIHRTEIVEVN